jgi:hypothetical protein
MMLMVLSWCSLGCAYDSTSLADRPELQGFSRADVAALLSDESTDFGSEDAELEANQQAAQGWAACRDVYEVYDHLLRTGDLQDAPEPAEPERKIPGTAEMTEEWIELLYTPLREGDLEVFRTQMSDDFGGCGDVPVNASGDRSLEIADALAAS